MPIVQLFFPNVINTSVQVGDYAYFSNPTPVGPTLEYPNENNNVPGGGTHTPHMTNDQSEIIMIGEILEVGEWQYADNDPIRSHDTFAGRPPVPNAGFIRCDMPQDLFNQYWDQIRNSNCIQGDLISNTCDGLPHYESFQLWAEAAFDNPTVPFDQIGSYARPFEISGGSTGVGNAVFDFNVWERGQCYDRVRGTGGVVQEIKWGDASDPNNSNIRTAQHIISHLISSHGANLPSNATYTQFIAYQQSNISKGVGGYNGLFGHDTVRTGYPCDCEYEQICPEDPASFIMFSKDNKANMSSLVGYYASVELRNNSLDKAELFNVGSVFTESSK
tara:strand:- start:720 stop:1715 length:996 start_codon:yes stop_codon:yes gene_type:complete